MRWGQWLSRVRRGRAPARRRKASGEPLAILCFRTHHGYQANLAATGHDFYLVPAPGTGAWDERSRPFPANYRWLERGVDDFAAPPGVAFDLVISQSKSTQYEPAVALSRALGLPLLSLEHTLPLPEWGDEALRYYKAMRGDLNVFVTASARERWGWRADEAAVIEHGIDTEFFRPGEGPRAPVALSVVNQWRQRDWACGFSLWQETSAGLPVRVVGDNPGLSRPAASVEDLAQTYRTSRIFLNTSLVAALPLSLLEAMASGCAVVSTATGAVPDVITHGVNGLLANEAAGLHRHVQALLNDPELAERLGRAGRRTIVERYGLDRFARDWDAAFRQTAAVDDIAARRPRARGGLA
jgi:glycosyltransferase involved in cell wall biosynthesis